MRGIRNVVLAVAAVLAIGVLFLAPAPSAAQYVDGAGVEGSNGGAGTEVGAGGAGAGTEGDDDELPRTGSWRTGELLAVGVALVAGGGLVVYGVRRRRLVV